MTREQTERGRIDRTRTSRVFEAIRLTCPLVNDILPLVERVFPNEYADDGSLKAAAVEPLTKKHARS